MVKFSHQRLLGNVEPETFPSPLVGDLPSPSSSHFAAPCRVHTHIHTFSLSFPSLHLLCSLVPCPSLPLSRFRSLEPSHPFKLSFFLSRWRTRVVGHNVHLVFLFASLLLLFSLSPSLSWRLFCDAFAVAGSSIEPRSKRVQISLPWPTRDKQFEF